MSIPLVSFPQAFPAPKIAIVLINFGEPQAPTRAAAHRFLRQLLADARLVRLSKGMRWLAGSFMGLFFRSLRLAKACRAIGKPDASHLRRHTEKLAKKLARQLVAREHAVDVVHAMRYGEPGIPATLERLMEEGYERIVILPLYPQYADATTGAVMDAVGGSLMGQPNVPELRFVRDYHDHEGYIAALAESVRTYWEVHGGTDKLLMSFRGIRHDQAAGSDAYVHRCQQTAALLAARLGLNEAQFEVAFHSGLGFGMLKERPIESALIRLAADVPGRVDIVFPGVVTDGLDTLVEVDIEARKKYLHAGGQDLRLIACLNDGDPWVRALADIAEQHLLGWPTMQGKSETGALALRQTYRNP